MLIAIFESTAIKFFPWIESDFTKSSGGYPTASVFRLIGIICYFYYILSF